MTTSVAGSSQESATDFLTLLDTMADSAPVVHTPSKTANSVVLGLVDGTNTLMRPVSISINSWRAQQKQATGVEPSYEDGANAIDPVSPARTAAKMICDAAQLLRLTHVIVALDHTDPSQRKLEYPDYKGHRTVPTGKFVQSLIPELTARRLKWVQIPGYEADDVVATYAERAAPRAVTILSSDSDLLCLASERVRIVRYNPRTHDRSSQLPEERFEIFTPESVCAKFKVPHPERLTEYKALVGEKGDNVPGVPGIGPVKASKLLAGYESIEQMAKLGVLGAHATWALQAKAILTLRTTAPVPPIMPADCRAPWR